ncbi:hypothetical protein ACIBG4_40840 [Nonomuraea sp. NPDC050383]|uniref:hypothetical protein n=1 Tax=Nonomuraea sp. NPDC050383 TaxID=3364362 RepID=UPI0037A29937
MADSTSAAADDKPSAAVPEIPECDVTEDGDGSYRLRHKGSGDTATGNDRQDVVAKGAMLRILAVYARDMPREIPFTAGDRP